MARQDSVTQFTGTIGNLIFYKSVEGYLARKKGGISAERIRTGESFVRTRENNAEFRRAVRASKLIRGAFPAMLHDTADPRVTGRLNGAMVKVLRGDAIHARGERTVTAGQMSLLIGFDFNKHARLAHTFVAPFTARIDRASGTMVVDIPSFIPNQSIAAPGGAAHFRLKIAGAAFDFEKDEFKAATATTTNLALTATSQPPLQLSVAVPPNSPHALMLILGIQFVQTINNLFFPLNDVSFNAMAVVRIT